MPELASEILDRINPTKRTLRTQICLRPDLLDEHTKATDELARQQIDDATSKRLGSGTSKKAKDLAQRIVDLEQQIEDGSVWVTLVQLDSTRYYEIGDEYPPRPDHDTDRIFGYNRQAATDRRVLESISDPVFDEDSWERFKRALPSGEYDELVEGMRIVNGKQEELPKSQAASRILAGRARKSAQPATTE